MNSGGFQSPFGDGRFLTTQIAPGVRADQVEFQSPFGDGRFLTGEVPVGTARVLLRFNPLSEMAAF